MDRRDEIRAESELSRERERVRQKVRRSIVGRVVVKCDSRVSRLRNPA